MSDDRFCEECGVDLGLHGLIDPDDEPTPDDCRHANAKADLMSAFFGAFR